MKLIVAFSLLIAVGCILASGCVAQPKKDPGNTTVSPKNTITPFINTTPVAGLNASVNATNTTNVTPKLKGSLKVSISGIKYPVKLLVVLDNETVGTVEPTTPLYLEISEGNHTVMVCASSVCKQENVTTRFGKYVTVDFSEQIENCMEICNPTAQPTARILHYNRNGNTISIDVEFFNPSTNDLLMSAEISCGYTYIDDRNSIKMGDSVRGKLVQNVKAGQRITEQLDLYFTRGNSLSYGSPVIEDLQIKKNIE